MKKERKKERKRRKLRDEKRKKERKKQTDKKKKDKGLPRDLKENIFSFFKLVDFNCYSQNFLRLKLRMGGGASAGTLSLKM